MQDRKKQKYYIIPSLITGALLIVIFLANLEAGDTKLLYRFDAPIHDRFFRLRNYVTERSVFKYLFKKQPISQDITLVGIDDYTIEKLGLYGRGQWVTRKPFVKQLEFAQKFFKPAILAYDIILAEISDDRRDDDDKINNNYDGEKSKEDLLKILQSIRKFYNEEITEIDIDTLDNITKLINEQGDINLALMLSLYSNAESIDTKIIAAYDFRHPDKAEESRTWDIKDILGNDDDDLSEDNGRELPYLRDVSIPIKYVHDLPLDYKFSHYATMPSYTLLDYVKLGYINVPRDEGGVVRRVPLIFGMEYEFPDPHSASRIKRQFFLPSISLLSCLYYWGIDLHQMNRDDAFTINGKPIIEIEWGKYLRIRKSSGETIEIPIDESGNLFLDFVSRVQGFKSIHFADVGPHKANEKGIEILKDKIAMVGITSTGASDVGACPVDDNTPFVLIHMTAISNILTQTFIKPLPQNESTSILIILAILSAMAATCLRPLKFSYYTLISMVIYGLIVSFYVFTHNYLFPVTGPFILISLSYFSVIIYYYIAEEKEKKKISGMFSTMVSQDVLQYLTENPETFSLAGRRADATMFFSDVAGFTTISEKLTPEKLVELLNLYLSPMTEIIMDSHGFVDKYEGDAIMAEWGVPYPMENHATAACWAALDQQAKLSELVDGFNRDFDVDLTVRMGLNSGSVSAGNMGSDKHFSFTVMGDAVNQAARFEPANKDYDTDIMIGQSTYELAKDDIEARLLDKIVVKGKTVPIQIYELVAKKGEISKKKLKVLELYDKGLYLHWERKWNEAIECLDKALSLIEDDGPSKKMRERIKGYKEIPPPENWQGEYVRTSKD